MKIQSKQYFLLVTVAIPLYIILFEKMIQWLGFNIGNISISQKIEHSLLLITLAVLIKYTYETQQLRKESAYQNLYMRTPQLRIHFADIKNNHNYFQGKYGVFTNFALVNEGAGIATDIRIVKWTRGIHEIPIKSTQQLRSNDGTSQLRYVDGYDTNRMPGLKTRSDLDSVFVTYSNSIGEKFEAEMQGCANYSDGMRILRQSRV